MTWLVKMFIKPQLTLLVLHRVDALEAAPPPKTDADSSLQLHIAALEWLLQEHEVQLKAKEEFAQAMRKAVKLRHELNEMLLLV